MTEPTVLADPSSLLDARFFVPVQRGHRWGAASSGGERHAGEGLPHGTDASVLVDRHQARWWSLVDLVEQPRSRIGLPEDHRPGHQDSLPPGMAPVRLLAAWDRWAARGFALACATRVLPILRWHAPDDDRPDRVLATVQAGLGARETRWREAQVCQLAQEYEADIAEHACHPAILPAARACIATIRPCAWGSARVSAAQAADAEANRAAWDAAWMAARDAAWFACTSAETDAASAAAWERTWAQTFDEVRRWQAVMLAERLGLDL